MKKYIPGILIGIATGIVNGLFGSGGGTLLVPCMEKFLKTEPQKAHAGAIAVILPLSVISIFLYLKRLNVGMYTLLPVCLGGIPGGFIGAKILGKISPGQLHLVFGIFMLLGGIRMVF